jgi:hypothetical protein
LRTTMARTDGAQHIKLEACAPRKVPEAVGYV